MKDICFTDRTGELSLSVAISLVRLMPLPV
jgi:hypothetical protein